VLKLADPILIGERLIALRGSKSREEVAKCVGTSVSAIQMYENGRRIPRDEIKVRLARFYGTSVEDIFFAEKYTKRVFAQ
jgi:transcriptional regulator with XRE-family HTH domain